MKYTLFVDRLISYPWPSRTPAAAHFGETSVCGYAQLSLGGLHLLLSTIICKSSNRPAASAETQPHGAETNWADLVFRIEAHEHAGVAELYAKFSRGVRYFLLRQLGPQDLEDRVHDVMLALIKAIQSGSVRDPERLPGLVRTITQRTCAHSITSMVRHRRECGVEETADFPDTGQTSPETKVLLLERAEILHSALSRLNARDQEILRRFYLQEESPEQICREMNLSETQFQLLKSRAKARLGEIGRRKSVARASRESALPARAA